MGEKKWNPANVLDVFGDRLGRRILVLASEQPVSAQQLSESCGVAPSTVYRRIDALRSHDLLEQREHLDDGGNQYRVYETTIERATFEIQADGYTVDMAFKETLADQFEGFWSGLEPAGNGERRPQDVPARSRTDPDI